MSGSTITADTSIVVTFDKSMNTLSLVLGGNLAAESDGGSWSATNTSDDTLTIGPVSSWSAKAGRTVTVDARDTSGNPLATLELTYAVPIVLASFQAASTVLGQPDFTSSQDNQGGMTNANTLSDPVGAPAEGSLYLADRGNHRVVGYFEVPPQNDANADFVVGKDNFFGNAPGTSPTTFTSPLRTSVDGSRLFLLDSGNHRVLIWDSLPTANVSANVAVGQPNFFFNQPGTTATTLRSPIGLAVAAGKLLVADTGNHRVMVWINVPSFSGEPADLVLGQSNFTDAQAGLSASRFDAPVDVWTDGERIVVADSGNHRLLLWNSFPEVNGEDADLVVGQTGFDTNLNGTSATELNRPLGVYSNGLQLFVADAANNRVVLFESFPTANGPAADLVIGQPDFTSGSPGTSSQKLRFPTGVNVVGNSLFVTDNDNARVLIFDGM